MSCISESLQVAIQGLKVRVHSVSYVNKGCSNSAKVNNLLSRLGATFTYPDTRWVKIVFIRKKSEIQKNFTKANEGQVRTNAYLHIPGLSFIIDSFNLA